MGGFDQRDVFLGFDGSIALVGTGLARVRASGGDPISRDLLSLTQLAARFSDDLAKAIAGARSASDAARRLRRGFSEACSTRREQVGSILRRYFDEAIQAERACFGLSALH
jgi:hypothetical protein